MIWFCSGARVPMQNLQIHPLFTLQGDVSDVKDIGDGICVMLCSYFFLRVSSVMDNSKSGSMCWSFHVGPADEGFAGVVSLSKAHLLSMLGGLVVWAAGCFSTVFAMKS